jgi:hypothetical protein
MLRQIGIIAVIVVAGCSTAAPPTAPTATTGSLPTPTVDPGLTQAQLAQAYLACTKVSNARLAKDLATLRKVTKLTVAKAALSDAAGAITTFTTCVRSIAWTNEYLGDEKALLKAYAAVQVTALVMSKAKTWSVLDSYSKTFDNQSLAATSAANLLRGDLGLPPPPVN